MKRGALIKSLERRILQKLAKYAKKNKKWNAKMPLFPLYFAPSATFCSLRRFPPRFVTGTIQSD